MATPSPHNFVLEGWSHLRLQRPLAAWASWQQDLRVDPDDHAAVEALATLESTAELPAAARAVYRFLTPADPARRERWNARLAGEGLEDLGKAAEAFGALAADDPTDSDAWLNRALCLAWLGRNTESIACLDRVVVLLAETEPQRAADAWTVAEVLRLGAGAEAEADDLRYVWEVDWPPGAGPPDSLFENWPCLQPIAMPDDPLSEGKVLAEGHVYEWLDRPLPAPETAATMRADRVPRVIASVIRTPRSLRLSTPDTTGFDRLDDLPFGDVARLLSTSRREATPLPLAWADAALGTFRFPPGLDENARHELSRGVVEHYFEGRWIHVPRKALGGLSPLEAARASAKGDAVARARLAGVIRFREQLGARPSHAALYLGYPFDRVRRRLGLIAPEESAAIDPDDPSCMSEPELDRVDPAKLDGETLAEAFLSANVLRDDTRTARFAVDLLRRNPPSLARLGVEEVVAPVVREAIRLGDPDAALDWLERARAAATDERTALTLTIWSAEVLARSGRPDEALAVYQALIATRPVEQAEAIGLDGAETLLDNGYPDQASTLKLAANPRAGKSRTPDASGPGRN
jgi:tetratricopeptide (TPR) repeat protein